MRSFYFCTLLTQTLNKLRKKNYNVFGNVSTSDPIISLIFIFHFIPAARFDFIHAKE